MLATSENIIQWLAVSFSGLSVILSLMGLIVIWFVLPNASTIKELKTAIENKEAELKAGVKSEFDQKLSALRLEFESKLALLGAEFKGTSLAITQQCAAFEARFVAGHTHMGKLDEAVAAAAHRDQELRIELIQSINELKDGMVTKDYLRELLDERT